MVHAQKVCRQPQTGVPLDPFRQGCVLHQAAEMSQQEHHTHRGIKKMGPGSSQGDGRRSRGIKTGERFSQCLTMRTDKHQQAAEAALHPWSCSKPNQVKL